MYVKNVKDNVFYIPNFTVKYKFWRFFFVTVLGSEGKLSMPDQRISVLQAIGNVSKNAVSGANTLQNLSANVVEKFLTLLQAEGSYCWQFKTKILHHKGQWYNQLYQHELLLV